METLELTHDLDDERLALLDPVTLLPSRPLFLDRCGIALARARRAKTSIGLVVVTTADLDESEGPGLDVVRRRVAIAVTSVMRADDTVARFDNRFVIVGNDLRHERDLATIATRLTNVLRTRRPNISTALVAPIASPAQVLAMIEHTEL